MMAEVMKTELFELASANDKDNCICGLEKNTEEQLQNVREEDKVETTPRECTEKHGPNSPSTVHTIPLDEEQIDIIDGDNINENDKNPENLPLMVDIEDQQPVSLRESNTIQGENKNSSKHGKVYPPRVESTHISVDHQGPCTGIECPHDDQEKRRELNNKRPELHILRNNRKFLIIIIIISILVLILVTTSIILAIYMRTKDNKVEDRNTSRNNAQTPSAMTGDIPFRSIQSLTLHIDWKVIQKENPRTRVNITWEEIPADFIHLEYDGRVIRVMENGTYFINMLLNLDVDRDPLPYRGKQSVYVFITCIHSNKPEVPKCQRQCMLPKSAVTVPVTSVMSLKRGDYIWVDVKGVDQIYKHDGASYLIITRYPE